MNIGESIKNCRNLKNLTQKQLSELTNIPVISIGRYERGENSPDFSTLLTIAQALNITIDELIKGEIEDNKKHWEAIKDFGVNDIKELIEQLKKLTLTKSDKKILLIHEKLLNNLISVYESSKDIDINRTHLESLSKNISLIENTLKIIKDKYI